MSDIVFLLASLLLPACILFVLYASLSARRYNRSHLPMWYADEAAALSAQSMPGPGGRPAFEGRTAETVIKKEEIRRDQFGLIVRMSITRTLRSPEGDYFFWRWSTEDKPFIKPISHASAKVALKRRYVPPTPP